MAVQIFITMKNAYLCQDDGLTAWYTIYKEHPQVRQYPFGALVFYRPALGQEKDTSGRWESRLIPALLVTCDIGPGGLWKKTYGFIK